MSKHDTIVGLDIGSSKVSVVVGRVKDDGQVAISGIATAPSDGLSKGQVISLESVAESIRNAIAKAEEVSSCKIESVVVGIGGNHIKGSNQRGVAVFSGRKSRSISWSDVKRAVAQAQSMELNLGRQVLSVIPREFIVDDNREIKNPVGMLGTRLEVIAHVITGSYSAIENIKRAVEYAGLTVDLVSIQPLATGDAVLEPDEKDLGVILIDMGAGTTDIAIYTRGSICHTEVIPIGGEQITKDVAICLHIPLDKAEEIKRLSGLASLKMVTNDETIEVHTIGRRTVEKISRSSLVQVIESRIEELFGMIINTIGKGGFDSTTYAGIVLTGGGSKLNGIREFAEEIFQKPVRLGYPIPLEGLSDEMSDPSLSTAVGLFLHGAKGFYNIDSMIPESGVSLFKRMAKWLSENI